MERNHCVHAYVYVHVWREIIDNLGTCGIAYVCCICMYVYEKTHGSVSLGIALHVCMCACMYVHGKKDIDTLARSALHCTHVCVCVYEDGQCIHIATMSVYTLLCMLGA